ncbi:hypothetical protein, partial [uncultured Gammaproteobacteria bacterium]
CKKFTKSLQKVYKKFTKSLQLYQRFSFLLKKKRQITSFIRKTAS